MRRVQRDKDRKRVYVGHRLKAFWMFIQGSKIISLADVATRYSVLGQPRPAVVCSLMGMKCDKSFIIILDLARASKLLG